MSHRTRAFLLLLVLGLLLAVPALLMDVECLIGTEACHCETTSLADDCSPSANVLRVSRPVLASTQIVPALPCDVPPSPVSWTGVEPGSGLPPPPLKPGPLGLRAPPPAVLS